MLTGQRVCRDGLVTVRRWGTRTLLCVLPPCAVTRTRWPRGGRCRGRLPPRSAACCQGLLSRACGCGTFARRRR